MTLYESIANHQEDLISTLQECIRIPSVYAEDDSGYPYGLENHRCLEYVLEKASAMGFSTHNMDDRVGWCEYGEGEEMVVVLGHLDVVPAGVGWDDSPFSGAVEDGRITGKQRDVLWNSLGYWTQLRQDAEKYNSLVDVGLSADKANGLMAYLDSIVPKPGKAQPSDAQKWEAIVDFSGLTAKQEDAALREYMDDKQEAKYDAVLKKGLTAQDYVDAYNAIQEESGEGKKKRVIAEFQKEYGMSYTDAKALYEIFVKPSK